MCRPCQSLSSASLVVLAVLALPGPSHAAVPQASPPASLTLPAAATPPKIDGRLEPGEWPAAPLPLGDWVSYNPLHGDRIAQTTTVWAAYDKKFLYFAFRCVDPEPARIKTSVSRRDNVWNDDWVGLKLDAMGDGQTSYDMFVNPSGVQGDILTSSAAGENSSVDWVWDSAAQQTPEGYTVELRVPVQSIRFKSGAEVLMRVLFWRRVSRLGVSVSWPDLPPGKSSFERTAPLLVRDLTWPGVREVIPAVTQAVNQARSTPSAWQSADGVTNVGLSAKFGVTSAVTLDGTINPDFSQVESDTYQVQVNQRYPIFYSEKRPFFMEGMGVFEVAGTGGDGNMATAVHTRRIIDPLFGLKVSGTLGKITFGTITASDEAPGRLDPESDGKRKMFNIFRATYSLGPGRYVGAIVTDTEFAGSYNRVAGSDVSLRFGSQELNATVMKSSSADSGSAARSGLMGQASYSYNSRRLGLAVQGEHYDRDFQMDTAFYNRTGIDGGWAYAGVNFYPDKAKVPWIRKVNPFAFVQYADDDAQGGHDLLQVYAIRMNLTRSGSLRGDVIHNREAWAGREFDQVVWRLQGGMQVMRWLNVSANVRAGDGIYYDTTAPFVGPSRSQQLTVVLQPGPRLAQRVSIQRETLDNPSGGRVYDVRVVNARTTYQFTARLAVRGIVQYDSSNARILADFLGSYEVRPGTVFYAGYGSLFERRGFENEAWVPKTGAYLTTSRGLFIKASYLHRF
jgi:hypothetical protein